MVRRCNTEAFSNLWRGLANSLGLGDLTLVSELDPVIQVQLYCTSRWEVGADAEL